MTASVTSLSALELSSHMHISAISARITAAAFSLPAASHPTTLANAKGARLLHRMVPSSSSTAAAESFNPTSSPPPTRPFDPPDNLRGVFVGSGSDGMSHPKIADTILTLTRKSRPHDVSVLYLGTATYDLPNFRARQTERFVERGCKVQSVDVATTSDHDGSPLVPSMFEIASSIRAADVIVVGGGNTLYAVDRWTKLGIVPHLREAMDRGTVLTGGSAGAICWFDGGHSDSTDPDTYRDAMIRRFGGGGVVATGAAAVGDESGGPPESESEAKDWSYIRVAGLGFLPGLMCPHNDVVQSNGILRARDFDGMLLRHGGELGICIDHWAALVLDGKRFRVLSLEGKEGSVVKTDNGDAEFCPSRGGVPGVWIKEVREGRVRSRECPDEGEVRDLLKLPSVVVVDDLALERCRTANPS